MAATGHKSMYAQQLRYKMKVILGASTMIFNKTHSKVVDDTLAIIAKYKNNMAILDQWAKESELQLQKEYQRRYKKIVSDTEVALQALMENTHDSSSTSSGKAS